MERKQRTSLHSRLKTLPKTDSNLEGHKWGIQILLLPEIKNTSAIEKIITCVAAITLTHRKTFIDLSTISSQRSIATTIMHPEGRVLASIIRRTSILSEIFSQLRTKAKLKSDNKSNWRFKVVIWCPMSLKYHHLDQAKILIRQEWMATQNALLVKQWWQNLFGHLRHQQLNYSMQNSINNSNNSHCLYSWRIVQAHLQRSIHHHSLRSNRNHLTSSRCLGSAARCLVIYSQKQQEEAESSRLDQDRVHVKTMTILTTEAPIDTQLFSLLVHPSSRNSIGRHQEVTPANHSPTRTMQVQELWVLETYSRLRAN